MSVATEKRKKVDTIVKEALLRELECTDPRKIPNWLRLEISFAINRRQLPGDALESLYGQVWDEDEVLQEFTLDTYIDPPFVHVVRKSDGCSGLLTYQFKPRFYFLFRSKKITKDIFGVANPDLPEPVIEDELLTQAIEE